MHWIFDNLQFLIFIAGAVAWWLNQRAREKAGESADYDDDGTPEARPRGGFEDPELAERTRKIREDIQRRIAERRRAAGAGSYTEQARPEPAPLQPREAELPPVLRELLQPEEPPPVIREVVVREPTRREAAITSRRNAEMLEQQAALAEQLKQAEEMKAAAKRRAAYEARVTSDSATAARTAVRGDLLQDLHGADSLRRAFVLREVLGPPVGLR